MKNLNEMRKINKRSEGYQTRAERKKERNEIKKKSQMEKKFLIGIYDDYRAKGLLNHLLDPFNCKLVGVYSTEPNYNMYYSKDDDNCIVSIDGDNSIKVEVWEINESSLNKIEKSYNYYSEFENYPQDYMKNKVLSPFGMTEMYFVNNIKNEDKLIISGDWIEYLNYKKVIGDKKENVL